MPYQKLPSVSGTTGIPTILRPACVKTSARADSDLVSLPILWAVHAAFARVTTGHRNVLLDTDLHRPAAGAREAIH